MPRPIRILLVDDDPEEVVLTRARLEKDAQDDFELLHAPSIVVAQHLACVEQYDVVMVDYRLSSESGAAHGLDLIRWLYDTGLRMPMLLVSEYGEVDLQGFEDLLDKGLSFLTKDELHQLNLWDCVTQYLQHPLRVLVVEDDKEDLELIRYYLGRHPYFRYEVSTATTFENARRKMEIGNFDVVVCDYLLGAHAATPWLLDLLNTNPDVSIVLVTAELQLARDKAALQLISQRKAAFLSRLVMDTASLANAINNSRCRLMNDRELQTLLAYS